MFLPSFFFLFFLLVTFCGRTAKSVLSYVIKKGLTKIKCDQGLNRSLDTQKTLSVRIISQVVIRDAYGTWHGLCTVTSIHGIQKCTRNCQKLGNKLVRPFSQWMAEDSMVKTERNRVDKQKSLSKKKEVVQVKKLIAAPC